MNLDIDDWDDIEYALVLSKVNNYIRSMTKGKANMDIGNVEPASEDQQPSEAQAEEDNYKSNMYDLSYMGGTKGKGDNADKGSGKGKGKKSSGKKGDGKGGRQGKGKVALLPGLIGITAKIDGRQALLCIKPP